MDENWLAYLRGRGQDFNPYGAGDKNYGTQGSPNLGPTNTPEAYASRDMKARVTRNALLRRMQAGQSGHYMSSAYLTPGGNQNA